MQGLQGPCAVPAPRLLVLVEGSTSTRVAGAARRRGCLCSSTRLDVEGTGVPGALDVDEGIKPRNAPLEIVDNVHIFPGQAHRWARRRGWWVTARRRRGLDVNQGRCRLLGDGGGGARRSGSASTRGWVTPLGWGLPSVAVARAEPERAGAQSRPWFSITSHYRKLESGTKRASPRGAPRKRNRRAATGSEQSRRAERRWDEALSAEHQQGAEPQTKRHAAATCTNVSVCISARSRGIFEPLAFPLPASFSRRYAHLRAPAWRRRVRRPGAWANRAKQRLCCFGLGCTAARETPGN